MLGLNPFHLAIPVNDLDKTRLFYTQILGCTTGRSSDTWLDLNFFGHQLVLHIAKTDKNLVTNPVDGHNVPVPHFGIILKWDEWQLLTKKLQDKNIDFIINPYIRFKGLPGEQATMFFYDPSGNALEFKAFKYIKNLFAT